MDRTPTEIDKAYLMLLHHGLTSIRNQAANGNTEYCKQEAEHLHEVPHLVGCDDMERHLFYVRCFRASYLEWVATTKCQGVLDLVHYFYKGPWNTIDEHIKEHHN